MALATDLRPGDIFKYEGIIYEVIQYQHIQRPRLAPLVRLKIKNFKLGTVTERTFSPDDKLEDITLDYKNLHLSYNTGDTYNFMDTETYEQYEFTKEQLGEITKYLKEDTPVTMMMYQGEILGVKIPLKVDLKVVSAPPAVKGNTVNNATKQVTVETGAVIDVPLFIKEGDIIRIDTRTGEYVERVK
ncbi:MAG: elongation factor P [Candidatus Goldbacteria bacterium]|nr:elongation factor P [Candidatus Goldiibacteriota bacterium]